MTKNTIQQFDNLVAGCIAELNSPILNKFMMITTDIFSPLVLIIIAIFLSGFYYKKNKKEYTFIILISIIGGWLLVEGLKLLIARPRPEGGLFSISGYSFPSAHASIAIIFFFIIAYILKAKEYDDFIKVLILIFLIAVVFLVGVSRIYLGVHWFSDVLGGYIIGYAWAAGVIIFGSASKFKKPNL